MLYSGFIKWIGRFALENISNSDMLYHDVDHTMLVATVGQKILTGKHRMEGGVTPHDWIHFVAALVLHDIGYVGGIFRGDAGGRIYATGVGEERVELPAGGSDAALTPYHEDRSKRLLQERFGGKMLVDFDTERVISYIEMTRFPPPDDPAYKDTSGYTGLARASDFIGQLGGPDYMRKIPALFYEFLQFGANKKSDTRPICASGMPSFSGTWPAPTSRTPSDICAPHWTASSGSPTCTRNVFEVEHAED